MKSTMYLTEAAAYIGKSALTLRRLYYAELIDAELFGNRLAFKVKDLDKLKRTQYPEGMSHVNIADRYDVSRQTVIRQFDRLHVKPLAIERSYGRKVYDEATVTRFAKILGWVERQPEIEKVAEQSPASSPPQ